MEFDSERDRGIGVSSNAVWNLMPRIVQKLGNDSKAYTKIVKNYLENKGLSRSPVAIKQVYRVTSKATAVMKS